MSNFETRNGSKWLEATNSKGEYGQYRLSDELIYRDKPEEGANYPMGFKPGYYRTVTPYFEKYNQLPELEVTQTKDNLKLNTEAPTPQISDFKSLNLGETASENNFIWDAQSNYETADIRREKADQFVRDNYGWNSWGKHVGLPLLAGSAVSLGFGYAAPWLLGTFGSELMGAANIYGGYHGIKNLTGENGIKETFRRWNSGDYVGAGWSALGDTFDLATTALPFYSLASKVTPLAKNLYANRDAISDFSRYLLNNKNTFGVNEATGDFGWFKTLPENYTSDINVVSLKNNSNDIRGGIINFGDGEINLMSSTKNSPENSQLVFGRLTYADKNKAGNYWMRMNSGGGMHGNGQRFDKSDIKSYWMGANKFQKPGTYASGDMGSLPYGNDIIKTYENEGFSAALKKLTTPQSADSFNLQRTGLSTDSYSSIIRQGQREGNSLRWGEGFTDWNDFGVDNKYVYDAWTDWKNGTKTFDEYESIFNNYAKEIGGKPLEFTMINGVKTPVHPHPFVFKK